MKPRPETGVSMKFRILAACFVALSACEIQAGEVASKAAEKLTLSGYLQSQLAYRDNLADSLVNSSTYIKRARIKFHAEITEFVESQVEIDPASSRLVKDAFVGIMPSKALRIQFGQFKRPFSQEELFSSSATPVTDLGLTNALVTTRLGYSGRSQGLQARVQNTSGVLDLTAGGFTGAGEADLGVGDRLAAKQTDINNRGKDWAARAGALLGNKDAATLHIGANASARSVGGNYTGGDSVLHQAESFLAYGGDAELKRGGLTVWAEALTGDNFSSFTDSDSSYSAPTFLGWHAAANFLRPIPNGRVFTAWQLEGRYEIFDPDTDTDHDGSGLLTGGLAIFLGPNVRWRTDGEWTSYENDAPTTFRLISELQAKF